jgi:hypothetical protein
MRIRTLIPWLLIALAGLGAAWLRYGLIEPADLVELCTSAQAPAWCALRQALVMGFLHEVYGIAAVIVAALSLLHRSRALACLAAMLGAFALQLYNYEPGALALLVGCLRLVHLQGAGVVAKAATPARSPESARR